MGTEIVSRPSVVVDTNVFLSSVLFKGECAKLVPLWQQRRFVYLLSRSILDEYIRALSYPKFQLTEKEVKALVEDELLPFVDIIKEEKVSVPKLKDRDDEKFLIAAVCATADYLVTGDKGLLTLKTVGKTRIASPSDFLKFEW